MKTRNFDLEDRLVNFAVLVLQVVEALPDCRSGRHIAGQLIRSGTSPAPNYGEAQSAESPADFVHKLKVALKELRETLVWLKIIAKKPLLPSQDLDKAQMECSELIAILAVSIKTAQHNAVTKKARG